VLDLLGNMAGWLTAALVAIVILVAQGVIKDKAHRRDLRSALTCLLGYFATNLVATLLTGSNQTTAGTYVRAIAYLLFAVGIVRGASSLGLSLVRTRAGRDTPKIMRDVINATLYVVAVSVVLRATLKVDLGGLIATSAVLAGVVGLALQETLGNLFAGLSLQMETPFSVGDWITVGTNSGKVTHVAWRAIRILTARNEEITIPNSVIAKESVINLSRSAAEGIGHEITIQVDYDSPPNAVRLACLDVLAEHPKVCTNPSPIVRISSWEESWVQYRIRFFTNSFDDLYDVASELRAQLWYRVRREGFKIPYPTRSVILQQPDTRASEGQTELARHLLEVDFLRPLGPEGIKRLAQLSKTEQFGRDETILRQGEHGDSFYLILSGEASVRVTGNKNEVARLKQGEFLGEMSLLTGEPRAATVVATVDSRVLCVSRAAFAELFRVNEQLAHAMSEVLAKRSAQLRITATGNEHVAAMESKHILERLREIFRLRG